MNEKEDDDDDDDDDEDKDPVLYEYSIVPDAIRAEKFSKKIAQRIPLHSEWWRRRRAKAAAKRLAKERAKLAIYKKQRSLTKIRVGIDDIKIVLGELEGDVFEARQRQLAMRGFNSFIKIDVDARMFCRFETNDELPVYIWYRKSSNPLLIVDIVLDHGYLGEAVRGQT